jgi:hypothetical protein
MDPQRLMRLELQSAETAAADKAPVDARAVVTSIFGFARGPAVSKEQVSHDVRALRELVLAVIAEEAMATYLGSRTPREVRAALRPALAEFASDQLVAKRTGLQDLQAEIRQVLRRSVSGPAVSPASRAQEAPPGSPIGSLQQPWCSLR